MYFLKLDEIAKWKVLNWPTKKGSFLEDIKNPNELRIDGIEFDGWPMGPCIYYEVRAHEGG